MLIETLSAPFGIANPTANATTASVTEPIPTITAPSGDGVIAFGHGGQMTCSAVRILPYGVGSDSNTFTLYLYGWFVLPGASTTAVPLWIPVTLATFTSCTLDSTLPGIAGTLLGTTQYFCSAITLGVGNSGISVEVVSPGHAAHEMASIVADAKGCRYLELRYAIGTATSVNALVARM